MVCLLIDIFSKSKQLLGVFNMQNTMETLLPRARCPNDECNLRVNLLPTAFISLPANRYCTFVISASTRAPELSVIGSLHRFYLIFRSVLLLMTMGPQDVDRAI
jgi:hypothetical protein